MILWDQSDIHMINNLSITFYAFTRRMLTSLSVDETLLPRYVNWPSNFEACYFEYIYIYIYREREREWEGDVWVYSKLFSREYRKANIGNDLLFELELRINEEGIRDCRFIPWVFLQLISFQCTLIWFFPLLSRIADIIILESPGFVCRISLFHNL